MVKRRQINKNKREKQKGNYELCWKFLKENRIYFLIITLIFFFSTIFGFIFPVFFVDFIQQFVENVVNATKDMNLFQLIIYIIENNVISSITGMLFGVFLGIFPVLTALMNGYVLGFVASKSVAVAGISVLLRILPHGIFEIPALIISLGLGLRLGMFLFARNKKKEFWYVFENSLKVFVYVVIPLLIVAGIIESLMIFVLG